MSGSFPLVWASLAYLGCPCFVWPLPVRFLRFCRYLVLRGSLFRCCFSGCLGGVAFLLLLPLLAWVLAVWPASSLFPPPFPPWLSSGVFCSSLLFTGPSLRISGCICNGPVAIPLAWRVVGDRLLSSLRLMATKASALCGALPSPPCGGCCSCAPRSGTEVFALG